MFTKEQLEKIMDAAVDTAERQMRITPMESCNDTSKEGFKFIRVVVNNLLDTMEKNSSQANMYLYNNVEKYLSECRAVGRFIIEVVYMVVSFAEKVRIPVIPIIGKYFSILFKDFDKEKFIKESEEFINKTNAATKITLH